MPSKYLLIGEKFGSLLVVGEAASRTYPCGTKRYMWSCLCECGTSTTVAGSALVGGYITACGCVQKTRVRENNRKYKSKGLTGHDVMCSNYKEGAKVRNLPWTLTKEEFDKLVKGDCCYCFAKPAVRFKGSRYEISANGIDRVDNSLGYIVDNCVSACSLCNRMKGALSRKEFLEKVSQIYICTDRAA